MNAPLFDIIEKHLDDPGMPRTTKDLPEFISECHVQGYHKAAMFLQDWVIYFSNRFDEEWDENCLTEPIL